MPSPSTARASAPAMAANSGARRPILPAGISAPSRMAVTGDTRVARSAGPSPASTVTMMPTASETMIVRAPNTVLVDGRSMPTDANTPLSSLARPRPATRPIAEATVADRQRLDDDRAQHLAPAGAERPQQRELTRALRDRDRERVVDRERAHEHGDAAEREQEHLQEVHERLQAVEREAVVIGSRLDLKRVGRATPRAACGPSRARPRGSRCSDPASGTAPARRAGRTARTWPCRSSRRRRTWRCRVTSSLALGPAGLDRRSCRRPSIPRGRRCRRRSRPDPDRRRSCPPSA